MKNEKSLVDNLFKYPSTDIKYTYYFEYETEKHSQDCDTLSTAICLGIMDKDNNTGEFIKIMNSKENIVVDKESFEFIYKSHTVTVQFWQNE